MHTFDQRLVNEISLLPQVSRVRSTERRDRVDQVAHQQDPGLHLRISFPRGPRDAMIEAVDRCP